MLLRPLPADSVTWLMAAQSSQCSDFAFLEELLDNNRSTATIIKKEEPADDGGRSGPIVDAKPPEPADEGSLAKRRRRTGTFANASPGKAEAFDAKAGCHGCGRLRDGGMCFRDPSQPVVWAYPDGRGHWCADCHTTWRTMFSSSHTIALFATWIQNPSNLAIFHQHLLAYISFGAVTVIRREAFEERVELIQNLLRLSFHCWRPMACPTIQSRTRGPSCKCVRLPASAGGFRRRSSQL